MEVKKDDEKFYVDTEHGPATLYYKVIDNNIVSLFHTFTPLEERGKGIAEELAKNAFEFAISNGMKVKIDCSYIKYFVEKHQEYKKYVVGE
ncbi:MAG: GNAT family N-acetyltransferase [Candidatus Micrarchaeia archaeon]